MDESKYNRVIQARCPTCGGTFFSSDGASEDDSSVVKCASCDRTMTRGELRSENRESIEEHAREIGEQAAKDIADELRQMLKKTFGNSKNFTIK
ncbi:hypothetical protein Q3O98_21650 [Ralstonia pseudosolanacearum]|uniref:ECs_2282 family putative zinc-binding protein n=1 Tax=Ralstonia pseudosolanacearum TaxID=1310165 RepID=UPI001C74A573|nr:hypothetical protein [Ralstonia pseudosolanacearum]MDO3623686.1 hypothetical protein [Ralstonia pseudosolanacearum]QWQ12985.1 hypothetical protein KN198_05710 [Ralstonia solanacearum]